MTDPAEHLERYLVGGAVRDHLLNYPVYDRDWVVVGATVEEMQKQGYKPVGKEFPVFLHPETKEEYALARTERKSGHGYKGFEFFASPEVTLEQDLLRRDLTINAMAKDSCGNIADPYDGQRDLEARILRHVSPAFAEDPLRVLRVARFAARFKHLGFVVAPETMALMSAIAASQELQHLTRERVWAELERALGERSPEQFLLVLEQCHALTKLIPEFAQILQSASRDKALNSLLCSTSESNSACPRFAALCYFVEDEAPTTDPNGHALTAMLERLKAPNEFKSLSLLMQRQANALLGIAALSSEQKLRLYEGLDIQRRPQRLPAFLQSCRAIAGLSSASLEFPPEKALQQLRTAVEAIQPKELAAAGFKGKALGEELRNRRLQAIEVLP